MAHTTTADLVVADIEACSLGGIALLSTRSLTFNGSAGRLRLRGVSLSDGLSVTLLDVRRRS